MFMDFDKLFWFVWSHLCT